MVIKTIKLFNQICQFVPWKWEKEQFLQKKPSTQVIELWGHLWIIFIATLVRLIKWPINFSYKCLSIMSVSALYLFFPIKPSTLLFWTSYLFASKQLFSPCFEEKKNYIHCKYASFYRRTMYFIMVFIHKVTSAMLKLLVCKLYIGEITTMFLFAPNIKPCTGLFSADFQINQLVRLIFIYFIIWSIIMIDKIHKGSFLFLM